MPNIQGGDVSINFKKGRFYLTLTGGGEIIRINPVWREFVTTE
jgi:hypothetical protein